MKKLIFAFIICIATSFDASAQTPPLNKQQTLDYINELAPKAIQDPDFAVRYSLSYADLIIGPNRFQKISKRYNLLNVKELKLINPNFNVKTGLPVYELICIMMGSTLNHIIVQSIVLEDDAKRLKKAFEYLVELVKKEGDPFGN